MWHFAGMIQVRRWMVAFLADRLSRNRIHLAQGRDEMVSSVRQRDQRTHRGVAVICRSGLLFANIYGFAWEGVNSTTGVNEPGEQDTVVFNMNLLRGPIDDFELNIMLLEIDKRSMSPSCCAVYNLFHDTGSRPL